MAYWQVRVTFDSGALMVFGVEAGTAAGADYLAQAVLDAAGLPGRRAVHLRLPGRELCQECGSYFPAGYFWARDCFLCESCRRGRTDRETADGGRMPA